MSMTPPMLQVTKEEGLLLRCARIALSPEDSERTTELLRGPLDWEAVAEKAEWHRLSGLLFHHLRREPYSRSVPPAILKQLSSRYHYNVARYLYQKVELRKVLGEFARERIPAVVLKGGALVEVVYKDPGLRPMNDVDLLVAPKDAETAHHIISTLGYASNFGKEIEERTRAGHRHLPTLASPTSPVVFEVHWHITRPGGPLHFDISDFWGGAREARIHGSTVLLLAPEHMLMHLCIHFFLDRRYRTHGALAQLVDIAETVRRYPGAIDWPAFTAFARKHGAGPAIRYPLLWSRALAGADVPDSVLDQLGGAKWEDGLAASFVRDRVLNTHEFIAHDLVPAGSEYRTTRAVTSLASRLVPDRVTLAERYRLSPSSKRVFLYYPRRWWDGARALARSATRPSQMRRELKLNRWMHSVLAASRGNTMRQQEGPR